MPGSLYTTHRAKSWVEPTESGRRQPDLGCQGLRLPQPQLGLDPQEYPDFLFGGNPTLTVLAAFWHFSTLKNGYLRGVQAPFSEALNPNRRWFGWLKWYHRSGWAIENFQFHRVL